MNPLIIYTIYDRPEDFPDKCVVRRHFIENGESNPEFTVYAIGKEIEDVRRQLPVGLTCVGREVNDEAQIVESWI